MKLVLNCCYGYFSLSDFARKELGLDWYADPMRDDPALIALVEKYGARCNGRSANLQVITLPDNCTDWTIREYDGLEEIIYVVNGKLCFGCDYDEGDDK